MANRLKNDISEEDKKIKVNRKNLKEALQIFRFVLPYKYTFIAGLVFLFFSSITAMVFPLIIGQLVDSAVSNTAGWLQGYGRNEIAGILIAILLVQAVFSYSRIMLFAKVSENTLRDIRYNLYSKMMSLSVPFFDNRRVGELTSRITSDVTQLQDMLTVTLAEFFRQITILVVGIAIILFTSFKLTLVMMGTFPVLILAAMVFGKFIRRLSKKVQDDLANANTVAEETLQSVHVVKAFSNERYETARYGTALQKVISNALKAARYRGVFASFVIFAIFGGIVLVLWYGLGLIESGEMKSIGELITFIILTTFIGGAVGGMGEIYGQLQKTIGASERIGDILRESSEIEMSGAHPDIKIHGDVVFDEVQFFYPTRPELQILKGVTLEVAAGQKIALVGHSGAGKSTIVQLLLRFYEHSQGSIFIDGKDISTYNISSLRSNVGVVPQEVILFGGTIRENIAYGRPDATDHDIWEAARQANALDFISSFPEGLDTIVGERGIKLSGGQRQRIAIARAILKDPTILILDEATSSLDAESERLVQDALDKLMQGRTTIIIAHRLATIRKVDTIYVLKEGRIIEKGNHEELLLLENGLYNSLVKMQFEPESR
jgi:ATP-binding cassette, subfamily B, bacterial